MFVYQLVCKGYLTKKNFFFCNDNLLPFQHVRHHKQMLKKVFNLLQLNKQNLNQDSLSKGKVFFSCYHSSATSQIKQNIQQYTSFEICCQNMISSFTETPDILNVSGKYLDRKNILAKIQVAYFQKSKQYTMRRLEEIGDHSDAICNTTDKEQPIILMLFAMQLIVF